MDGCVHGAQIDGLERNWAMWEITSKDSINKRKNKGREQLRSRTKDNKDI